MQLSGANLKARRIAAGFTREAVAIEQARTAQTVMAWETGRQVPSGRQLAELAVMYGCMPGDFFVEVEFVGGDAA